MKTRYALLCFLSLLLIAATTTVYVDYVGKTYRYRQGAVVTFDGQSKIQDEDKIQTWNFIAGGSSNAVLRYGDVFGYGVTSKSILSGRISHTNATEGTNTFTSLFRAAPVVLLTSSNGANPYVDVVTTSNFTFGTTISNVHVHWIAIGSL